MGPMITWINAGPERMKFKTSGSASRKFSKMSFPAVITAVSPIIAHVHSVQATMANTSFARLCCATL